MCDQTNFTIITLLRSRDAQSIAEALIYRVIYLFGPSKQITCDKAAEFTSHICRATTRPPRPSSTAECLHLIARLRGEQASAASWEPRPPFEATEMD